jgi:hypothetical protein
VDVENGRWSVANTAGQRCRKPVGGTGQSSTVLAGSALQRRWCADEVLFLDATVDAEVGLRWPRAGVVSTTKPSGEQNYPSRRAGCIKRSNTLDGGGATHGQAQLPADEQQASTEGGCPCAAGAHMGPHTHPCRRIHWLSPRRPCPTRLLCHSGSRGTSSKVVDDVPRTWFLRLICIQTLHGRLCHVFLAKNRVYSPKGHRWV